MESKTIAMGTTVELSVPAAKEMMLVVRLTTAAVMARVGLSADGMDEMKMAVEEAANCLIQTGCVSSIKLSFVRVPEGVSISLLGVSDECAECTGCDERKKRAVSADELAVIRCILETMADEVALHEERGCIRAIELLSKTKRV
ncbi:MAG: hypothetical protein Q4A66_02715 [Eubacteriales bacterium]|nr:hypothetical protein [Eubacteriales bacterium]